MIALLLAAQLTAAGTPADMVMRAPPRPFVMRVYPATRRCKAAGRLQTSLPTDPEPALLLRPQDRIAPRKLKDLPPGTLCLTANPQEAFR